MQVVERFNTWTPGESWLLLDTCKYDLASAEPMSYPEFEDILIAITHKFPVCGQLGFIVQPALICDRQVIFEVKIRVG